MVQPARTTGRDCTRSEKDGEKKTGVSDTRLYVSQRLGAVRARSLRGHAPGAAVREVEVLVLRRGGVHAVQVAKLALVPASHSLAGHLHRNEK